MRVTEHDLAVVGYVFGGPVDKLVQFTLKGHVNVLCSILSVDFLNFSQVFVVRAVTANKWILSSKEGSENLKVSSIGSVTAKFVDPLLNSISKRIFPILVVDFAPLHIA